MKRVFLLALFIFFGLAGFAQQTFKVNLWADGEIADEDYKDAVLHCYLAAEPTGRAVIACPGGAYEFLCMTYEGWDFAPILNPEGVSLFVLQYRLPRGRHAVPLADAQQAMRYVRSHAAEWGIREVGIMGSSAGGHLATTVATHFTDSITRPDFQVLLYPVVSMEQGVTHAVSRDALLGSEPSPDLVSSYSNELHVTARTPRAFIVLPSADKAVAPRNSLSYAQALVDNGVPVDLHMYEGGYHGFGCRTDYSEQRQWIGELLYWLKKK